ncbi:hypothetical protein [Brevundimonas variabilis]|uniref:Uncharacterized protein n=1 Tax=Brevundimonas variabilis TaxID=74312 RepID=A0A7W9FHF9_9CAUL|nr:hypothetical protein [Brevundimonas variabilis]MBB5747419.1 hypothetical protein [Brevundimonas variabilis]
MDDKEDELPRPQSKLLTYLLFVAVGALTMAFWGAVIWLCIRAMH